MPDSSHFVKQDTVVISVRGAAGKHDVVTMLKAISRSGALTCDLDVVAGKTNLPDILIDTDKALDASDCAVERVSHSDTCSCLQVKIRDTRLMVKVTLMSETAVRNALYVLLTVDSLGGDLALAALALANIKPRESLGETVARLTEDYNDWAFKPHALAAE